MLRAEDCACLRYAVGCLEHREKAAEWFRGLAEVLQGMADTHGAEAKAVALRFRRILDDSDPAARLDEALGKCADFAERCFIGGARPETPATAPAAEKAEARHREVVDLIRGNGATLAKIEATTRATDGKVDALIGRGADFAVKPSHMALLITAALAKEGNHKGITGRTVENWVRRLREGAPNGTNPPEGFTLNTLRTLETAAEFAAQYAAGDARRLRVTIAFNEHDSRLEEEAKQRHTDEQKAMQKRLDG
ncbi:MAG: hypothetical protein IJK04_02280 [Kiritimatiellae bacterium]|nr:hypothetical protein [Kiritimatiellia bacterium]